MANSPWLDERLKKTIELNPLTGTTVMVEAPDEPAVRIKLLGVAVSAKSGGSTIEYWMIVEWESVPLVPVTVMFPLPPNSPAWTVRIDAAVPPDVRNTLIGASDQVVHAGGGQPIGGALV